MITEPRANSSEAVLCDDACLTGDANKEVDISVIIPAYNVERYIQTAIDSVLSQTFADFEIIVVDDKSTDNTVNTVRTLYSTEPRVRLVCHSQNRGLGPSRNTGMENARGQYVTFLDGDDWIENQTLEKLFAVAKKEHADVVACGMRLVYSDGQVSCCHSQAFQTPGGSTALALIPEGKIAVMSVNRLYAREMLERNQLRFPAIIHEDIIFTIMAVFSCVKYISVPDMLYNYFQSPVSLTRGTFSERHLFSHFELIRLMKVFFWEKRIAHGEKGRELCDKLIEFVGEWSTSTISKFWEETDPLVRNTVVEKAASQHFGDDSYFVKMMLDSWMKDRMRLKGRLHSAMAELHSARAELEIMRSSLRWKVADRFGKLGTLVPANTRRRKVAISMLKRLARLSRLFRRHGNRAIRPGTA